jgi:protein O-GlcNAc transferase
MNRHQRRAAGKQGRPSRNPAGTASSAIVPSGVAELFAAGVAHHRAGRLPQAETCYRQVLATQCDHTEALHLLGVIAQQIGRHDVAVHLIRRAIERNGNSPIYFCNLGDALRDLGNLDDAVAACRQAIRMKPDFAEAYSNLGLALKGQGKLDEAIAACREAVRIKPALAEAHFNLGNALRDVGKVDEAIAAYRQALRINPSSPKAHCNLGAGLFDRGNFDEAMAAYREAIRLKPDFVEASSALLGCMNYSERLTPAALFDAHCGWDERHGRPVPRPDAYANVCSVGRRLKVGYVSPDFRQHSVAYFLEPLLRSHDRNAIEVFCYAEVSWPDAVTERFKQLADHWVTTVGMSDDGLAERIRRDGIDILVDLVGHTAKNRLPVFARKPAPIQVTWLGYPNTTGLKAIDYRLVDVVTDPNGEADALASETLVRLPEGFLCYGAPDEAPLPAPSLTTGVVTFGSFNSPAKLSAATLDAWAQVLARLPKARLLLKGKVFADDATRASYFDHLGKRRVAPERVEFVAWLPDQAHLALYHRVDIALDPFPYNGTTTTCEALWMGVPVVALRGDRHAGRVGASLLTQIGMTDLIADSVEAYVDTAVALAGDRVRLSELRHSLRSRMAASPLCDASAFTRKIEDSYRTMWQRWCAASTV